MHSDHAKRRGPLVTLGLGTLMLITVGVFHAPSSDANVDTGGPPASTGDSFVLDWRSDGPRDVGKRTSTPVPDDGAQSKAATPATDEDVPAPVPATTVAPATTAAPVVETVPEPVTVETTPPPPPPVTETVPPTVPVDEPVKVEQDNAPPDIAEPVVVEPEVIRPEPDGTFETEVPDVPTVVDAGKGPAEPVDGAVTLIDPVVIERPAS